MTKQICIAAFDPGLTGAMCFYFPAANAVACEDLPVVDGELDLVNIADKLDVMKPDYVIVEKVGSMPGQGVSSTFKFGMGYGGLLGVIAALRIPSRRVSPATWKRALSLSADKEQSRARALQTWPDRADVFARKKDHGRAEAALLAKYAAEHIWKS